MNHSKAVSHPKITQKIRVRHRRRKNIPIPTAMFQAFGWMAFSTSELNRKLLDSNANFADGDRFL